MRVAVSYRRPRAARPCEDCPGGRPRFRRLTFSVNMFINIRAWFMRERNRRQDAAEPTWFCMTAYVVYAPVHRGAERRESWRTDVVLRGRRLPDIDFACLHQERCCAVRRWR